MIYLYLHTTARETPIEAARQYRLYRDKQACRELLEERRRFRRDYYLRRVLFRTVPRIAAILYA